MTKQRSESGTSKHHQHQHQHQHQHRHQHQHQHQHQNYRNWPNPFLGGVSGVATARGGKVSPLPVERSPTLLTHISPSSPRSHPTYTKPSKPPHWFLLSQTSPSFWVQIPLPSNALDSHPVAWWKSYSTDRAHTKRPPYPSPLTPFQRMIRLTGPWVAEAPIPP